MYKYNLLRNETDIYVPIVKISLTYQTMKQTENKWLNSKFLTYLYDLLFGLPCIKYSRILQKNLKSKYYVYAKFSLPNPLRQQSMFRRKTISTIFNIRY